MIVTRRGHLRLTSRRAARWLQELAPTEKTVLPEALALWIAGEPETPFCWEANGQRILFSLADHTRKGSRCLILEECAPTLRSLTPREAAVLHWVGYSKTNEEIAGLLHIKVCTVKKHLLKIYEKLGVENRTAAAFYAREFSSNQAVD